jgi:alpha-mannosidase
MLKNWFVLFIIVIMISLTYPIQTFAQTTPKRIYIGNDDHTDYMWTANEATYKTAFIDMLDYYLNQVDATISNSSDFQGRFNADGSLWMWTYEKNKTATDMTRLINRIKDGHITVPLNAAVMVYGGQPAEAVIRGMYYPGRIERKYNLRLPLALAMENQTLPLGRIRREIQLAGNLQLRYSFIRCR